MGNLDHETLTARDEPKFEPWLGVLCASFVPILLSLVLPRVIAPYLLTFTGILMVAGVVLMVAKPRVAKDGTGPSTAEGS